jgi:hypothetical protein
MERTQVLNLMRQLKLYGTRQAYDGVMDASKTASDEPPKAPLRRCCCAAQSLRASLSGRSANTSTVRQYWMPIPGQSSMLIDS